MDKIAKEILSKQPLAEKKNKILAICGFAPATRKQTPWDDESIDIAGLNEEMSFDWFKLKSGSRLKWFQLHTRDLFSRPNNHNDPHHWEWLQKKHDFPIYMQQKWEDIPSGIKFPLEDIYKEFGNYFTSTLPFIMAWGVLNGYKRLEIYGFDMASNTEYLYQRPNAHFFIGYLRGKGIDVYIPPNSKLMQGYGKYAYEDMFLGYRQELDNAIVLQNVTIQNEMGKTNQVQGAYEAVREASAIYPELNDKIPAARDESFAQRDRFAQMKGWVKGMQLAVSRWDAMIGMERSANNEDTKVKAITEAEIMADEK